MLIIIDLVRAVYEIKHTDVPQYLKKTAAVSDELKEANRRDAASNEWEKKKKKRRNRRSATKASRWPLLTCEKW